MKLSLSERFKRHVQFLDDSDDSCWIWVGALTDIGTGAFWKNGRVVSAHRVAWELLHGKPIPPKVRLVQECSHPQCVRHWRLDRPWKKLSDEKVEAIRQARGIPAHALATIHGVGSCYVRQIWCGAERSK